MGSDLMKPTLEKTVGCTLDRLVAGSRNGAGAIYGRTRHSLANRWGRWNIEFAPFFHNDCPFLNHGSRWGTVHVCGGAGRGYGVSGRIKGRANPPCIRNGPLPLSPLVQVMVVVRGAAHCTAAEQPGKQCKTNQTRKTRHDTTYQKWGTKAKSSSSSFGSWALVTLDKVCRL